MDSGIAFKAASLLNKSHMITNQTIRFSDKVAYYAKYRPTYPDGLIPLLTKELGLTSESVVADIGSGTGISSEPFLKFGCTVFGIEPNENMRQVAVSSLRDYPNFHSISATAEATTLEASSVDVALAAQAFHWFDAHSSRKEFQRILKPNGKAVLIWNERKVGTPFLDAYENFLQRFGTDYKEINHIDTPKFKSFFGGTYTMQQLDNVQAFDFDGLKGRLLSSSYIPKETDNAFAPMLAELQRLFEFYERNGKVMFEMDTLIFWAPLV
jgi:SAM-dependent methyltransferase